MNRPGIPASVLQRLPDWGDAESSVLTGGQSNYTLLLQKPGRRAVLKYDHELRGTPYNTRLEEARIQSVAAESGLANRVLYVDDRVLLSEYAEGDVWEPASLNDPGNLGRLAGALRRVHGLPRTGRNFDAAAAAETYVTHIDGDPEIVAMCLEIATVAGKPQRSCCCHNDLVAENIVGTPTVRLLDWEYACDNDPLFDLATVIEHHGVSEDNARHLLDAYFDGDWERWRPGLRRQRRLYQALLWLWLASRPHVPEGDLERAAEQLATNCS